MLRVWVVGGLCHILVELAVLSQGAGDRTTQNIFKEARKSISGRSMEIEDKDEHAELSRHLLKSKILNDVLMVQIFESFTFQFQCLRGWVVEGWGGVGGGRRVVVTQIEGMINR
jgi:hypothetical protein